MIRISTAGIVLVLLGSGCSLLKTSIDPPKSSPQDLPVAQTHFTEILRDLGPPSRITALPGGFAFLYEHLDFREMQLGLSVSAQSDWLSLLKITLADANLRQRAVLFHFRSDGCLLSVATLDRQEGVGMGGTVQLLFSVVPIVDTSEYADDSTHAMHWGMSLLDPLPRTLNAQQSLRTGSSGLELGGTPSKVGQHTLEM